MPALQPRGVVRFSRPLTPIPRDAWGYQSPGRTRSVDAHACRLRRKLALAGAPGLVANTRGVGYQLSARPVVAPVIQDLAEAVSAGNGRAA